MTLQKLIAHYVKLMKQNYETIIISQVVNDLRQVKSLGKKNEETKCVSY